LVAQPAFDHAQYVGDLWFRKWFTALNEVPLPKTTTATCGCGMLSQEDRVPAHRRLSSVIAGLGRGKTSDDELPGVFENDR